MIRKSIIYFISAFLVFQQAGDIHSHFCLDGKEPAVSLHFENLGGHPDHDEEEQVHNDYESELSINALQAKSSGTDFVYLINLFPELFTVLSGQQNFSITVIESFIQKDSSAYLPPLRAPPVTA